MELFDYFCVHICIPLVAGISLTGLTQEKHFHKHKVMVLLFETAKGISEVCNIGGIVDNHCAYSLFIKQNQIRKHTINYDCIGRKSRDYIFTVYEYHCCSINCLSILLTIFIKIFLRYFVS